MSSWQACQRKFRFATQEKAKAEALKLSGRGEFALHEYLCSHCHGYHLGHRQTSSDWKVEVRITIRPAPLIRYVIDGSNKIKKVLCSPAVSGQRRSP